MQGKQNVIAVDGPAGSGKSSIAKALAEKYHLNFVDTGSLFRTLGVYLDQEFALEEILVDGNLLAKELKKLSVSYQSSPIYCIKVNGKDYAGQIRNTKASELASKVSAVGEIRDFVEQWEREIVSSSQQTSILEGRDIGTVIFPRARLKFFLYASVSERAKRRLKQLEQSAQTVPALSEIEQMIKQRDHRDSSRKIAPLKKAEDAIEINSDNLTFDEVLSKMGAYLEKEGITHD